MSNLVKNELFKIFHKKSIYFFLLFVVFFYSMIAILGNKSNEILNDNDYSNQISMIEEDINELKKSNPMSDTEVEEYVTSLARLDMFKLISERNYDGLGPEYSYIQSTLLPLYLVKYNVEIKKYDYTDFGYKSEEDYKNKVNEATKKLDNFVPLDQVKNDLNNLNKENVCAGISSSICDEYFEVYKKVLQYRIENNVPYAEYGNSGVLNNYIGIYPSYLEGKKNFNNLNKDEKEEYENTLEQVKIIEYKMDHKSITGTMDKNMDYTSYISLSSGELSILIIFGILVIACSIISDEFDKGTIKQLLIKPYSRNKIVLSKIIACLITLVFFIIVNELIALSVGFIFLKGFNLTDTVVLYDFSLGKAVEKTGLELFGLYTLSKSFYLIIFTLIVLFISALSRNTALSAGSGFLVILLPAFLEGLIQKHKFIAYLPCFTWDMSDFLFGGKSYYGVLNFKGMLGMNIIYVILFTFLILLVFKHSEVKNQ